MTAPITARVVLLGASGYAGLEFLRLTRRHPGLTLVGLASREWAGRPAHAMAPGLGAGAGHAAALPDVVAPEDLLALLVGGQADTLVSALPHGALAALMAADPAWLEAPRRLLDLSADRRDGTGGFVYGLPELNRGRLAGAARVANPGCYPTASTLAALPAVAAGWTAGPFVVAALSGVTGAGRGASLRTSFAELDGGASYYKVGGVHPHVREMEQTLASCGANSTASVAFAPQLVPMSRGILATVTAPLLHPVDADALRAVYRDRYRDEPFIELLPADNWPDTRAVRGTNRVQVAVTTVHDGRTLLATAAIDNLVKGAAGQAIQNLNLMTGWPETTGLDLEPAAW